MLHVANVTSSASGKLDVISEIQDQLRQLSRMLSENTQTVRERQAFIAKCFEDMMKQRAEEGNKQRISAEQQKEEERQCAEEAHKQRISAEQQLEIERQQRISAEQQKEEEREQRISVERREEERRVYQTDVDQRTVQRRILSIAFVSLFALMTNLIVRDVRKTRDSKK